MTSLAHINIWFSCQSDNLLPSFAKIRLRVTLLMGFSPRHTKKLEKELCLTNKKRKLMLLARNHSKSSFKLMPNNLLLKRFTQRPDVNSKPLIKALTVHKLYQDPTQIKIVSFANRRTSKWISSFNWNPFNFFIWITFFINPDKYAFLHPFSS